MSCAKASTASSSGSKYQNSARTIVLLAGRLMSCNARECERIRFRQLAPAVQFLFRHLPRLIAGGAGAANQLGSNKTVFDMQLRFISFLLLLGTGLAVATDVDELKIETTYAPPECVLKAQSGDGLKVHYVSPQLDGRR
jgi:hypothetical protein